MNEPLRKKPDLPKHLQAQDLADATLSLKAIGESDFRVEVCDFPVGQIIARRRSFGRVVWFWSPAESEGSGVQ